MLKKEELIDKEICVDYSGGWHFASGEEVLKKAKRLAKTSGYTLADYTGATVKVAGISDIEKYVKAKAGVPFGLICYSSIFEYVDRKEKVYYFRFVGEKNINLGC